MKRFQAPDAGQATEGACLRRGQVAPRGGALGIRRREAGLDEEDVRVFGEVDDTEKWSLYRSADLFVLPTHSENFAARFT